MPGGGGGESEQKPPRSWGHCENKKPLWGTVTKSWELADIAAKCQGHLPSPPDKFLLTVLYTPGHMPPPLGSPAWREGRPLRPRPHVSGKQLPESRGTFLFASVGAMFVCASPTPGFSLGAFQAANTQYARLTDAKSGAFSLTGPASRKSAFARRRGFPGSYCGW